MTAYASTPPSSLYPSDSAKNVAKKYIHKDLNGTQKKKKNGESHSLPRYFAHSALRIWYKVLPHTYYISVELCLFSAIFPIGARSVWSEITIRADLTRIIVIGDRIRTFLRIKK